MTLRTHIYAVQITVDDTRENQRSLDEFKRWLTDAVNEYVVNAADVGEPFAAENVTLDWIGEREGDAFQDSGIRRALR